MARKWKLFKADFAGNALVRQFDSSKYDDLKELVEGYNLIGFPSFDHADSFEEVYKKIALLNHDPKKTAVWIMFDGNNANPIVYSFIHAVACEFGWTEGKKEHDWIWEVGFEEVKREKTFKEMVAFMVRDIDERIDNKAITHQVLETMCCIRIDGEGFENAVIFFYDIKDIACEQGWIKESLWVG